EQSGCDALGLEAVTDFTEGVLFTGDDGAEGGIDGGDGERRGKGVDGGGGAIFGGHDGGHLTDGGQGLDEGGALGDELEAVFEREDAGDAGGDVFADAVADDGGGFDAPGAPQLGESEFEGEESRLGVGGLVDGGGIGAVEDVEQGLLEQGAQDV